MKLNKLLIANRGEIAVRIINTCQALGIETVSIFSKGEESLPHVLLASEAYSLGEGDLSQTYLNSELILSIAQKSGAQAIHPGYGFLSENANFAKLVHKEGLVFIGPSAQNIELMGDKMASKKRIEDLKVPLIPGYHGDDQEVSLLQNEAGKIGYPVLIKASAGGGGKGMRIVRREEDFSLELESAKREAKNAFGDDRVLIEKYIENPRHIEVQVISDQHGGHYHLFERECSIQRRYQKIIEESPSPFVDDELREKMTSAAVKIAEGIHYLGVGTVEFIVDKEKNFYFLEMNTRLQVEHPVTEMITGYDLVTLQIEVALGNALPFKENPVSKSGHAIEMRIYAEDPYNNFMPSTGNIKHIGTSHDYKTRIDTGYWAGNDVSINFDPMCAKVICWGENRTQAIRRANNALNEFVFHGVNNNRQFLKQILEHPEFVAGNTYTSFIETYEDDFKRPVPSEEQVATAIAAMVLGGRSKSVSDGSSIQQVQSSWTQLSGFRNV